MNFDHQLRWTDGSLREKISWWQKPIVRQGPHLMVMGSWQLTSEENVQHIQLKKKNVPLFKKQR